MVAVEMIYDSSGKLIGWRGENMKLYSSKKKALYFGTKGKKKE